MEKQIEPGKVKMVTPAGIVRVGNDKFYALQNRPCKPLFEWERGKFVRWEVVPEMPLTKNDQGLVYSSPRHIVATHISIEFGDFEPIQVWFPNGESEDYLPDEVFETE